MAKSNQYLTKTNLSPPSIIEHAREIRPVENFFVGLPDRATPLPQNVLVFCSRDGDLRVSAKDTSHQRMLLVFSLEAAATVLLDGLPIHLSPSQALLIFPFQAHRYLLQDEGELTWLFVSFELADVEAMSPMRNRLIDVPPALWPFVDQLIGEYREARASEASGEEVTALLTYVLLCLHRACRQTEPPRWDARQALPSHRIVQRTAQHLVGHLSEPITVGEIAAALTISEGYLRTCFRRVLGMSVTTYVRRTRVHHACSLLSRTESNITQIAELCGFASIYAFSRAFKREINMSPTAYRKHLWENRNVVAGE